MATSTKKNSPTRRPLTTDGTTGRRLVVWLWLLGATALIATTVAVGYATGMIGEEAVDEPPAADEPADEPADGTPADEPADEVPAPTVRYDEELRANWDVTGVAADDVLNVRDAPGVDGAIVETLAHDAAELESTGRIAYVGDVLWREVVVPGDGVGWVNASFLIETT